MPDRPKTACAGPFRESVIRPWTRCSGLSALWGRNCVRKRCAIRTQTGRADQYVAETVAGYVRQFAGRPLHPLLGGDHKGMIGELAARSGQLNAFFPVLAPTATLRKIPQ